MTRNLTEGKPIKIIFEFAVPVMLGLLFQQLYSVVDTMIVGRILGADALASVGSTGAINFFVIGFCLGICNGFAIPVAQMLGAENYTKMRRFVMNSAYLCIAFSVVLTVITTLYTTEILELMNTPDDIFQGAYEYIFVIFLGIPTCFLYNMPAGIIRSLGDSKTPVYFLALAAILNVILDVVLIVGFSMGVAGAAIATVVSQGISGIACLLYMKKNYPILTTVAEERKIDIPACRTLCAMGIPMGLQYSITAIGSIILQTAVNGLGSVYVAAVATGQKLSMFFFIPYDALGATMATYCGQNVGARKLDRLDKGLRDCALLGFGYSLIAMAIMYICSPQLSLLFLDASEILIIQYTIQFMEITALTIFFLALVNIFRFAIQGMGFSQFAMLAGVLEMIARTAVAYLLVPSMGFMAVCLASPIAWILADLFLVPAAAHCIKRLKKMHQ